MRRTMFVVPVDLAAVVQASSTRALVPRERKLTVGLLEASGVAADGELWLRDAQEQTLRALAALGEAKAASSRRPCRRCARRSPSRRTSPTARRRA